MNLNFKGERVLAVVAHPDDAELLCAGTLARARRDGAAIAILVLCSGDKGQPTPPIPNLIAVRRREMKASARLIGAELFLGGFPDGSLSDNTSHRAKALSVFREFRPTLTLAHSPEDYHQDHRGGAAIVEAVSWFCASRGYTRGGKPCKTPPAVWWMDTITMSEFQPGFYVDISDFVELKTAALACHKSQFLRASESDFASLPELMRLQFGSRGMQSGVRAAEAFRMHNVFKRARAW
jgi:LmbE family N-acetylglucosaminyl deacetylase